MNKKCTYCGKVKPLHDFILGYQKDTGIEFYYSKCSYCSNRDRNQSSTDRARLRDTGCTDLYYLMLMEEQEGKCAICGNTGDGQQLCADHDHDTNIMRGLLCQLCNKGIGNFKDNPVLTNEASSYLRKYGK